MHDVEVSYERQQGGTLLFWCLDPSPDFLAWLDGQDLSISMRYLDAKLWYWSMIAWIFESPADAFWCRYRFTSQRTQWPYVYWEEFDIPFFTEVENDMDWSGHEERNEEEFWERFVGPLSLGSTGGAPMWQEGPRVRPLARPRRHDRAKNHHPHRDPGHRTRRPVALRHVGLETNW